MRILVLTVFLTLSSCSLGNEYSGRSAWAELNDENAQSDYSLKLVESTSLNKSEINNGTIVNSSFPTSRPKYILKGKRLIMDSSDNQPSFSNEFSSTPKTIDDIIFKKYELTESSVIAKNNQTIVKKLINPVMPITDVIFHEKYFSAAGSACERKRVTNNGDIISRVICRYEDGKELNLLDLTM